MPEELEIQKLKEEIKRLRELAYKDELSGLYNRRAFNDYANKFLDELNSRGEYERESILIKSFSLALFDIDDFKAINDAHGHQTGDRVLKAFAKVVLENVRDIDLACRWGGEEIMVGLVGANEEDALRIAERIRKNVADTILQSDDGRKIDFRVSGGVAGYQQDGDLEEMIKLADRALYEAKKSGKNKIVKAGEVAYHRL